MPYFCPTHQGLYVTGEEEGCQHDVCISYRNLDIPGQVIMGIGETHPEYGKKLQHKQFGQDMDSYREARRNGLQPENVSRKAVEKAEIRAEINERIARMQ